MPAAVPAQTPVPVAGPVIRIPEPAQMLAPEAVPVLA